MKIPTLKTKDLYLRPWSNSDAPTLFDILQEEDMFKYFPRTAPPSREWVDKYITHHKTHWQQRNLGHWAVVTQSDGKLLGWTGLEYLPELNQVEVAYLLSRKVWGKGFATQAAQCAVEYGFNTCRLDMIIGLVHPENQASIRVLEKCGLILSDRLELWGMELLRYSIDRQEK